MTLRRLLSFSLALAVIFCGSTVYYGYWENVYKRYITSTHEQQLSQFLNSVDQLETSLKKARYLPEGALRQTLAADVWKESQTATAALAALPLNESPLEAMETYIAQLGDYAYYLMRTAAYQRADHNEWETFCDLYDNASSILENTERLKAQCDAGVSGFDWIERQQQPMLQTDEQLYAINDEFPQYASLIYDGPYSDHILQRTAKALEGLPVYTPEKALEKAAALLGTDQPQYEGKSNGQIPCFLFSAGNATCSITCQGGFLLSLTDLHEPGIARLSTDQAVEKAQQFLRTIGLTNMSPSYHMTYEAICTISFISTDGQVAAYPDLIKVGVSLEDGRILRFDSTGYAMNHHRRAPAKISVSQTEARASIPEDLKVKSESLAYIPTTGMNEILCWEFVCEMPDGTHCIFYCNAETGQIENLLLLIEEENGTLTR